MASTVNTRARAVQLPRLSRSLVDWYQANARDLPWRRTRDPYAIWVSEVMLQQTRVEAVLGRWERFLARFPDVKALARAPQADVLAEWAGLGYYRRARQLHAAARHLVETGDGALPRAAAQLRLLPGFGRYTAGAVASIAFDEAVTAVDGNVERVVARLLALDDDPKRGTAAKEVESTAMAFLKGQAPREVNQALMELGALVCTPRKPDCETCPWRKPCRARATGLPEAFPRRAPGRERIDVSSYVAVVRREDLYLWRRRPEGVPNAGLWELPSTSWFAGGPEVEAGRDALEDLARELGRRWRVGEPLARVRHGITHHRIDFVAHAVEETPAGAPDDTLRWAGPVEAGELGLTAATTKLLRKLPPLL